MQQGIIVSVQQATDIFRMKLGNLLSLQYFKVLTQIALRYYKFSFKSPNLTTIDYFVSFISVSSLKPS